MAGQQSVARAWCGHPRGVVLCACLSLAGCDAQGAPSYSLFGAHFPASLLCVGAGLLGSLVLRAVLGAVGLEAAMPLRLLVYSAFAASAATWSWLALFGNR